MVKLTMDLIARGTSGYTKKKRDENMQHYVRRLTHLYLENRGIDDVGDDLSLCRNLIVLYLYDNDLGSVPCLNHNCSLTHLYLQNNNISKLENLGALTRLQKLYVGGNCITVVEGLERLHLLQELHVENQRLPPGEQILFDPRSLRAFADTLQVLNISGNNLTSIRDLEKLRSLCQLLAAENELNDMKEMAHLLSLWRDFSVLDLTGNPLCHKAKFKDRIIVMAKKIEILNGKKITETARQFLLNWHASRETSQKRSSELLSRQASGTPASLPNGTAGAKELPPVRSASTRHSNVAGYLMPGLPRKQFDEVMAKSNFPVNERSLKTRSSNLRSNYTNDRTLRIQSAPLSRRRERLQQQILNSETKQHELV